MPIISAELDAASEPFAAMPSTGNARGGAERFLFFFYRSRLRNPPR